MLRIALAGNPNCGKTTVFNDLTGSTQYVGNWAGVTVEKKAGKLLGAEDRAEVVDLPGIYSLSPYSLEEVVARDYLVKEQPEVILNIVDASNLERNLYLTHQLMETEIPIVMALNMMDVVKRRGEKIDIDKLSRRLGIPVVPICALKSEGMPQMIDAVLSAGERKQKGNPIKFKPCLEELIDLLAEDLKDMKTNVSRRWLAIKLLENDENVSENYEIPLKTKEIIQKYRYQLENLHDDDIESIITNGRYEYMTELCQEIKEKPEGEKLTISDRIDKILTNRFFALPIFFCIMTFVYWVTITGLGDMTIGWVESMVEAICGGVDVWLTNMNAAEWVHSFIIDGILGGLGSIFTFVPQLMLLYLFIGLLEDCGYMARVAFIMDRVFRRFGLSGKSFIPLLIGAGCSVPAINASKTIENENDRRMTIMLTPFIPCGAKLPVFALFIAAFFPDNPWAGASMYLFGICMVIISGIILKAILFRGDAAPFVMELPEYRMPRLKGVCIQMLERAKSFIIKAGTVMFLTTTVVWFLQTFNFSFAMVEADESILASFGKLIAPLFAPLGFGNWQSAVASATGIFAKESVVSTFGVLLGAGEEAMETDAGLIASMNHLFTPAAAYSFMIFTLLSAPCAAAIATIYKEMGSLKWTVGAILYQTVLAYVMAFIVYQSAIGNFINIFVVGLILIGVFASAFKIFSDIESGSCSGGCGGNCSGCKKC